MPVWPKDNDAELDAFFGGRPDGTAKWEVTNLVYIFPPWKIYIPETATELKRGLRVNKRVANDLTAIFDELWVMFGKSQEAIEKEDLHKIGGTYFFRPRRGSKRVSNHARGIAIDIDPIDNPMHKGSRGDMSKKVIYVFNRHGWRWGGVYGDPMHFEAVYNGMSLPMLEPKKVPIKKHSDSEMMKWIELATPLIKRWEGFVPKRYWDVKQWAIGYGQKADHLPDDKVITEVEASQMLVDYLKPLADKVNGLLSVKVTPQQGGALLSFAYNLGVPNLSVSTLLKKLNAGDPVGASEQFKNWVKASGKVLPGLVKRREAERLLFLTK